MSKYIWKLLIDFINIVIRNNREQLHRTVIVLIVFLGIVAVAVGRMLLTSARNCIFESFMRNIFELKNLRTGR